MTIEPGQPKSNPIATQISKLLHHDNFTEYDDMAKWRNDLQTNVRSLVAEQMTPLLNKKIAQLPHATYGEKKNLCCWVNEEVYSSGFAIRCPKTGLPARMHADIGDNHAIGRFQIELMGKENHPKKTMTSIKLFPIEIMDHPIRPETVRGYWARKAIEKRSAGHQRTE